MSAFTGCPYADGRFVAPVRGATERALRVLDRGEDALPMPAVAVEVIQPVLDRIGEA